MSAIRESWNEDRIIREAPVLIANIEPGLPVYENCSDPEGEH